MTRPAIEADDVGKEYVKYVDTPSLLGSLPFWTRTRRDRLWALRHATFSVAPGECVGVIGRNGSGKSTMLKMLAGVTAPSEGRLVVRGRIAPLVSVGVGFHPELTGRENIYVNAIIMGMSRAVVDARLEEIIDFAEIADFVDTPVKFYSSGMFVRLGFAAAIHADPDVLLVDEVLSVGDFAFQMKCFDRMMAIREAGTTVVVVSHNLNAVRRMCDRTILLHRGEQTFDGPSDEAIARYHQVLGEAREPDEGGLVPGVLAFDGVRMVDRSGAPTANVETGEDVKVEVTLRVLSDVEDPVLGVIVQHEEGIKAYTENTAGSGVGRLRAGEVVRVAIHLRVTLSGGSYVLKVVAHDRRLVDTYAVAIPLTFYVSGRSMVGGISDMLGRFEVVERERTSV